LTTIGPVIFAAVKCTLIRVATQQVTVEALPVSLLRCYSSGLFG
jgi:hypothetical protein